MSDQRCPAQIADHSGFHWYACGKKASTSDGYCRTHDPKLREERRKARGPTAWEREMAAKKAERERIEGIEADNAALRARLALLERVRDAAEAAYDWIDAQHHDGDYMCHALRKGDYACTCGAKDGIDKREALRAALDAAKEPTP